MLTSGRVQRLDSDLLRQEVIYSITGRKEEIWVGTQHHGLIRFQYLDGIESARKYDTSSGLAENTVYSVYKSGDGTIWAGTGTRGASR